MTIPYAGIICRTHGKVDIDEVEYGRQMARPNTCWQCPKCGDYASFDDERFEEINFPGLFDDDQNEEKSE